MDIDEKTKENPDIVIEELSPIVKPNNNENEKIGSNSIDQINQMISDNQNAPTAFINDDKETNENQSEDISEGSEEDKADLSEPEKKLKKLDFVFHKQVDTIQPYDKENYLLYYCTELFEKGYYDPKITTWMIENKSELEKKGITEQYIKWIVKQDKYYKGTNIINSMTYRITKFGKLAPQSDLVRKLNDGDNEENFKYYEEDSFIAIDEEDETRNDNYLLKGTTGLIKDIELINILRKAKKKELAKRNKNKNKIDKKLFGNKRSIDASKAEGFSVITNEPIKHYTSMEDFLCDNERRLSELVDIKKKPILIRDLVFAQRRKKKNDKQNNTDKADKIEINFSVDIDILSKAIKEDTKVCDLLYNLEIRKYYKENKWSSVYKALNKFTKAFLVNIKVEQTEEKNIESETADPNNKDNNIQITAEPAVFNFSSNKIIDKIEGIKVKAYEFSLASKEMADLVKENLDKLKDFYNPVTLEFRDPAEFCRSKFQSCFKTSNVPEITQNKFFEIYNNKENYQAFSTQPNKPNQLKSNKEDKINVVPNVEIKDEIPVCNTSAFEEPEKEKEQIVIQEVIPISEPICSPNLNKTQNFDLLLKDDKSYLLQSENQGLSKLNSNKKEKKTVISKKPLSSKYFRKTK